jgi:tRNA (mo5U34)-methyltransferase
MTAVENQSATRPRLARAELQKRIRQLGPWFHNMDLEGVQTAPDHFLGDYPRFKWRAFQHVIPDDLTGKSVLDIGCNGGFYSIEMKRRGADRVMAVDFDETYLAQAKFAAEVCNVEIEFAKLSVYDVASLREKFDLVIFMGVLYHLRHPLLALDLIREHAAKDLMLFQSMQRGEPNAMEIAPDYDFEQTDIFEDPRFPRLYFIERRYAKDPTNWWIPNGPCVEAMLRSAGFKILEHPEQEVYLCQVTDVPTIDNL